MAMPWWHEYQALIILDDGDGGDDAALTLHLRWASGLDFSHFCAGWGGAGGGMLIHMLMILKPSRM